MERSIFGQTVDGRPVERITLDNGALRVSVLTLGATLQDVQLAGLDRHLTIGGEQVADYEDGGAFYFFGPIVGPVANRIRNATAELDGRTLTFEADATLGHCLHNGKAGLHRKIWSVVEASDTRLVLATEAVDGEGGLPGNRRWEAEFVLGDGAELTLRMRAETDAVTFMNLANHSYWNLGDDDTFHGHVLQADADRVLPSDETGIVTGEILPVGGTPFDFRTARALTADDTLDNNFCLSEARTELRSVASLTGPDGLRMGIETTEPGLQFYDARHMAANGVPGHGGRLHGPRCGLAIEAQFWPAAPSQPDFPSIRMEPGRPWEQVTRFTFTRN